MGASKLRGKAYAEFLDSLGTAGFIGYLNENPMGIEETEKAMTPEELKEFRKAWFASIPEELRNADDEEDDIESIEDEDEGEEHYLPEDTEDENVNEFNKLLNEHDRKYWAERKKGEPIRKTI